MTRTDCNNSSSATGATLVTFTSIAYRLIMLHVCIIIKRSTAIWIIWTFENSDFECKSRLVVFLHHSVLSLGDFHSHPSPATAPTRPIAKLFGQRESLAGQEVGHQDRFHDGHQRRQVIPEPCERGQSTDNTEQVHNCVCVEHDPDKLINHGWRLLGAVELCH